MVLNHHLCVRHLRFLFFLTTPPPLRAAPLRDIIPGAILCYLISPGHRACRCLHPPRLAVRLPLCALTAWALVDVPLKNCGVGDGSNGVRNPLSRHCNDDCLVLWHANNTAEDVVIWHGTNGANIQLGWVPRELTNVTIVRAVVVHIARRRCH